MESYILQFYITGDIINIVERYKIDYRADGVYKWALENAICGKE